MTMTSFQVALVSAGLATESQANFTNHLLAREARQQKINSAYKEASKIISAGQADARVYAQYTKLRGKVSPELKRLF